MPSPSLPCFCHLASGPPNGDNRREPRKTALRAEGSMKVVGSLLALLTVLAIGYFIFKTQFAKGPQQGAPPMEQIDVIGVTTDLQAIAQAERMYLASHGAYVAVDQL